MSLIRLIFLASILSLPSVSLFAAERENPGDAKPEDVKAGTKKVLKLYHDADWSNHVESAESIWRGVETALSEVDHQIQGYRIELIKKDHRGNVARSLRNMKDFLDDEQALALVSGIHSPPLIKHRAFINENKIPTLVPWAAGGPITRYPSEENWVFRVSVDDTKAGAVLVDHAFKNKGCKAPHMLLENTPWGQSNFKSMSAALKKMGHSSIHVTRFNWGMKSYTTQSKIQEVLDHKSDCILLVANAVEGAEIAKAMASLPKEKRLPIISHWGISAGKFHLDIDSKTRSLIDIGFIQSCFSFMQSPLGKKAQDVFDRAKNLFPDEIESPIDIRSPVGFIHGYDITLMLIQALKQIDLVNDMDKNRDALRLSLENLSDPIPGLVKTYKKPFSRFSPSNIDAHEGLGSKDYCMAKYGVNDEILLLKR